jgi:tryptophan-rich sensory protein
MRTPRRAVTAYSAAAVSVIATAVIGARAVDTGTGWYRTLAKPRWQPPPWAFGAVWTPLYASIAWSAGHAALHTSGRARREVITAFGVNLAANAAWNWLFFGRRSVLGGLAGTVALDVSNADLLRRTSRHDRPAARALIPYAAWCLFATALNAEIARQNPTTPHTRPARDAHLGPAARPATPTSAPAARPGPPPRHVESS